MLTDLLVQRPIRAFRKASGILDRAVSNLPTNYRRTQQGLIDKLGRTGIPTAMRADYSVVRQRCIEYVSSLAGDDGITYRYAHSATQATLYSSVYALLIHSLCGRISDIDQARRARWLDYFDKAQRPESGLFYDPVLDVPHFHDGDWWGDRHLAGHMIMAYTVLGARPRYPFSFLDAYDTPAKVVNWLERLRRSIRFVDASNTIMNIGMLMQYQRDVWQDARFAPCVHALLTYMTEHMDPKTGLWWQGPFKTVKARSHAVQGAYHIHPLYLYDGVPLPNVEAMLSHVLLTQGDLGGYGIMINASGCEDIDSIFPLCKFGAQFSDEHRVRDSILRALPWVLSHQNEDGGFCWIRYRLFTYGHHSMRSEINESNLFGTWFRLLSLAYIAQYLGIDAGFHLNRCPGYEIR